MHKLQTVCHPVKVKEAETIERRKQGHGRVGGGGEEWGEEQEEGGVVGSQRLEL